MSLQRFRLTDPSFREPIDCGAISINPAFVASVSTYECKGKKIAHVTFCSGKYVHVFDEDAERRLGLVETESK